MREREVLRDFLMAKIAFKDIGLSEHLSWSSGAAILLRVALNEFFSTSIFVCIEIEHSGRSPPSSGSKRQSMFILDSCKVNLCTLLSIGVDIVTRRSIKLARRVLC
jgi:hypothetical protein